MSEKTLHDIANEAVDELASKYIMDKQHERIQFLDAQIEQLKKERDEKILANAKLKSEFNFERDAVRTCKGEYDRLRVSYYEVVKERDQLQSDRQILLEALERIQKQRFGAQGYYEEEDWKGLSSYYAGIIMDHENEARKAIKDVTQKETATQK